MSKDKRPLPTGYTALGMSNDNPNVPIEHTAGMLVAHKKLPKEALDAAKAGTNIKTDDATGIVKSLTKRKVKELAETPYEKTIEEGKANEDVVTFQPIPASGEDRLAWTREAIAQAAPIAAKELITHLCFGRDAWTRYRAACEVLDRAGFHKGSEQMQAQKAPMVIVNINPADIWKSADKGNTDPTIDVKVINKKE